VDAQRRLRTRQTSAQQQLKQRCAQSFETHLFYFLFHFILQERAEADTWTDGAKSAKAKAEKEEKRKAELARKAENARLLAEEEAATHKKKAAPKAAPKKAASAQSKPAGPGAIAAAGEAVAPAVSAEPSSKSGGEAEEIESFAATGIDNALDLIDVVTAKMDKASVGNQAAATIERHPEVRALVIPELAVTSDIQALALRRDDSRCFLFLSILSYELFTSAPRPHSTLTWIGNCPISEQKYAAIFAFCWLCSYNLYVHSNQGYACSNIRCCALVCVVCEGGADFRPSIGFALQAIPKVA